MRALSALALALLLSLTACGDGDDDSSSMSSTQGASASTESSAGSTDETPPATSLTTPALLDPDDQLIANDAVLTVEDMPAGWESAPNDDTDDPEAEQQVADCVGVEVSDVENDANATADSDEFTSPEGTQVSSSTEVAADEQWMTNAFAIQGTEQFRSCIAESLQQELAQESQDVEWGEVRVFPMVFRTFGDETSAFRVAVTAETQSGAMEVNVDLIMARVGRASAALSVVSTTGPMGAAEEAGYLEAMVERLESGLGDS